jgi:UTP--glucose-1-phosphate uridylyltransferase
MSTVKKAVIPAAGLGTRMLPATKSLPKEMLPVVDKPAIQLVVEEAAAAGIEDVLVVVSRGKESLQDHFDRTQELEDALARKGKADELDVVRRISELADIHFVRQHQPLGLGHAVGCARHHVGDEPFAVLLPDDLIESPEGLRAMIAAHEKVEGSVIALVEKTPEEMTQLGAVRPEPISDRLFRVHDIVEKPLLGEAPSNLAVVGRYVFTPELFDALDRTEPGQGGEIQLTDAFALLNQEQPVYGWKLAEVRYDTGKKLDYLQTIVEYALRHDEVGDGFRAYLTEVVARDRPGG